MKTLSLTVNGTEIKGYYELMGSTLWLHLHGRQYTYETDQGSKRSRKGKAHASDGDIVAPMPGKVTKLNVQVGYEVKPQQTLVVLEAMKMEYSLKAPASGKIARVSCQVGDQVMLGQILIEFEKV